MDKKLLSANLLTIAAALDLVAATLLTATYSIDNLSS